MGLDIFDAPEGVPEYYVDSARISANAFTIVLEMGVQLSGEPGSQDPPPTRRSLVLRMSPQHAVALNDLLTRNLAKYEAALGHRIEVPQAPVEDDK